MPQIIRFHETGDADVLRIEDLPLEAPGKGEVRLKIEAISYGVYGESAIVPDRAVAPYPNKLSATEGASIWMQYLTAYGALIDIGQLKKSDTVVITAASSTVGLAAIQVTRAAGALTIATTRGADKKEFLLEAGADEVIVTNEEDLAAKVMARTSGKGADLIFDPVGGPLLEELAGSAEPGALVPSN